MPAAAIFLLDLVFAIVVVVTGLRIGEFYRRLRGGGEPDDRGGGSWVIGPSVPGGAAGERGGRGHRRRGDGGRSSRDGRAGRRAAGSPRRARRR